ncbi:MAG: APC family permease, partial [Gemmataceae bacterium]
MPAPTPLPALQTDDLDLTQQGYRPEFRRTLGSFTAFAAGFSYLSILTGIVQNYALGFREAGALFWLTWPIVLIGQLLVARCFADLAREYPFCGGIYAWSRRCGSPGLGWMTGWIYLASLIVTLAAVALAWQVVLPQLSMMFQFVTSDTQNAAILGSILIGISTVLNVASNRWLSRIMNIGVVIELVAAVLLILLLLPNARRTPWELLQTPLPPAGPELGGFQPFLAAVFMAAYVMYGFDTAGTLAEETIDPRRRGPRAILQALLAAGGLGFLLLLAAGLSAPNLADPMLVSDKGGLPYIMQEVLGPTIGKLFIGSSVLAIFICTLAVHANVARLLFAMGRDRVLPGWRFLEKVDARTQSPRTAAVLVGLAGITLLLLNMNYDQLMIALVCVSIVWANLAYLLTVARLFVSRLTGGTFANTTATRRRGLWLPAITTLWSLLLIGNIAWPRPQFYGESGWPQYAAPLFTLILIIVGLIVY